ncbi:unnamed protein product, partial [Meganyctiphanes norvegica]
RPLMSLLQQSKELRVLHLHHIQYDHGEELLATIRQHCRHLRVLTMDCHMIPEHLLFRTFFNGMTEVGVLKAFDDEGDATILLSFPQLINVGLPHLRYDSKFILLLRHIRPSIHFMDSL